MLAYKRPDKKSFVNEFVQSTLEQEWEGSAITGMKLTKLPFLKILDMGFLIA